VQKKQNFLERVILFEWIISDNYLVILMVLVWIGIGIGVLIVLILIVKLLRTNPHSAVSFEQRCSKCGQKTNGLKCPKCDRRPSFGV